MIIKDNEQLIKMTCLPFQDTLNRSDDVWGLWTRLDDATLVPGNVLSESVIMAISNYGP